MLSHTHVRMWNFVHIYNALTYVPKQTYTHLHKCTYKHSSWMNILRTCIYSCVFLSWIYWVPLQENWVYLWKFEDFW